MTTRQLNILIFCLARFAWAMYHLHKGDLRVAETHIRLIEDSQQPLRLNED